MNNSLGYRAKSKALNREKILQAAYINFRDIGFEAATLRDIAKQAGLTTGAVFANFSDKTEILIHVIGMENGRIEEILISATDLNVRLEIRLEKIIISGYRGAMGMGKIILAAFVVKWTPEMNGYDEIMGLNNIVKKVLRDTLALAQSRGELQNDAKIDVATDILAELFFAAQRSEMLFDTKQDEMDNLLRKQIEMVIAGLSRSSENQS